MEEENQKITSDSAQITFKLTSEERQYLEKEIEKFDVTMSEYIRIKVLNNADQTLKLKSKMLALLKENKGLQIKLSRFQEMEVNSESIILPINNEIRKILEAFFTEFYSEENSMETNLVIFLMNMLLSESIFKGLAYNTQITIDQITQAKELYQEELNELIFDKNNSEESSDSGEWDEE